MTFSGESLFGLGMLIGTLLTTILFLIILWGGVKCPHCKRIIK